MLGQLGLGGLGFGADGREPLLHRIDFLLDGGKFDPDLFDALLGGREGRDDLLGPALLAGALFLEHVHLLGPSLELDLALGDQLLELFSAALHLGQATVEHLDLLAALGQLEAGLREDFLLLVAVGALVGDDGLGRVDHLLLRSDAGLRLGQQGLGLGQAGQCLVVVALEIVELVLHPGEPVDGVVVRLLRVLFLGMDGGGELRGGEHLLALLFQGLLGLGEGGVELVDDGLLVVVRLRLGHDCLAGLADVDFALHDAVGRLLVVAAVDQAAAVDQVALRGRDHQETERGIRLPEFEEGAEVIGEVTGR